MAVSGARDATRNMASAHFTLKAMFWGIASSGLSSNPSEEEHASWVAFRS
jgi:hypothetical protein